MASFGDFIGGLGKSIGAPELGISEFLNGQHGGKITNVNPGMSAPDSLAAIQYNGSLAQSQAPSSNGSVLGASTGGSGGGSAAAYNPIYDPTLIAQGRGQVQGDQNALNDLYNQINGMKTQYANEARGRIDGQVADQQTANDKSYAGGVAATNSAYGARGAFDSSYRGNDNAAALDAYNQSNKSLYDQRDNNYATIGQTLQGVDAQLADKPQYDLSQYNDVNALTTLHNQLGAHIAALQGTKQQLTPQGDLVKKLNSVAPVTSNLDATLKSQLDKLVSSNTPQDALLPLAQGYITRSGVTDPKQKQTYIDYLNALVAPAKQATPTTANNQLIGA